MQTVTKGEFARLINVTPGRVSQYIAEGKIGGDALAGEGRSARIVVDVARAQLRRTLDVSQMIGNGVTTRLSAGEAAPATAAVTEPPATLPRADLVADQIRIEQLRAIRAKNRREEEEARAREGIYSRTADVRAGYRRITARVLSLFEGGLATMASEIASRFEAPQRDVLHLMRTEMRKIRAAAATEAQGAAARLAGTEDDAASGEDEEDGDLPA